jgi:hypothetical protein
MSEDKKEIVPLEVVDKMPVKQSPIEMASSLIEQKVDPAFVEKMLDLQIKFEENEAKKAFHKAMAAFKIDCPDVEKDMYNEQYDSWYTSLGKLVSTISPHMSKHGLSHDWVQEHIDDNKIKVAFTVTHELGFSKTNSFSSPPDTSGKKNPIQQMKSAVTYLKSITFESGMGLASTESNLSDDGNKAHEKKRNKKTVISVDELTDLKDKMKEKGIGEDTILREYNKKELWSLTHGDYLKALDKLNKTPEVKV